MPDMPQHRTSATDLAIPARRHAVLIPVSALQLMEELTASSLQMASYAAPMDWAMRAMQATFVPPTLMALGAALTFVDNDP